MSESAEKKRKRFGYLMVAPAFLTLFIMTIYPFIYVVVVSFFKWAIVPTIPRIFIGLGQYSNMLHDTGFHRTLLVTFEYTLGVVAIELLLGFGIAVFVATSIGFMLLFLPGIVVIVAITFCCIYMMPLMTDKQLGIVDAVKESYAMGRRGELVDHVVVVIIFMAITMIGGTVFIGVLFTQPLATLFLLSTYEEKINTTPPPAPMQA